MIWEMLTTGGLAVCGVTLWTFRVAVTARGNRALGSVLAATEAMLFAVAFSKLMGNFESPHLVIAYGAGVALGTLLGLSLDTRLNPQLSRIDIFDPSGAAVDAISNSGFPFTSSTGVGSTGTVAVASVVTRDANVQDLLDIVGRTGSTSFWTVTPVRRANDVRIPPRHRPVPAPSDDQAGPLPLRPRRAHRPRLRVLHTPSPESNRSRRRNTPEIKQAAG